MAAAFGSSEPVSLWNESLTPCDRLMKVLVVVSVVQLGQAGFSGAICDTAIWASGAATQPAKPSEQTMTHRCESERIGWFLRRWAGWLAFCRHWPGRKGNRMRQRFWLAALAGKNSMTGNC